MIRNSAINWLVLGSWLAAGALVGACWGAVTLVAYIGGAR